MASELMSSAPSSSSTRDLRANFNCVASFSSCRQSQLTDQTARLVFFRRSCLPVLDGVDVVQAEILATLLLVFRAPLMLELDGDHALRLLQLGEALVSAPREEVAGRLVGFLVRLCLLEEIGVRLLQPHPFDLLLIKAEVAARAAATPFGVGRQPDARGD